MKCRSITPSIVAASKAAARKSGLRYVNDASGGWRREKRGVNFNYLDERGKRIRGTKEVERVNHLAIPPAWKDVWICPHASGHIQATGRDVRGRKQYRYHADWRTTRDATKFERMIEFGLILPRIRRRVAKDLRAKGLGKTKIIAAMVQLLEATHIRVGNEEYVKQNHSFGLSTLRDRHVKIRGDTLRFNFVGKSGKDHAIELHDARLAKIVRGAQDLPGQELFQYLDEAGERQKIVSEDVNAYLREIAGDEFSAKDFRTWAGTVLAAITLWEFMSQPDARPTKKTLRAAIEHVATHLGNTPAICRKCYIHPAVMDGYLAGQTIQLLQPNLKRASPRAGWHLGMAEMSVLTFLRKKLRGTQPVLPELLQRSVARSKRNSGR